MAWFHQHIWQEQSRTKNGGQGTPPGFAGVSVPADLVYRLLFGYTIILLKCAECGDVKTIEIQGQVQ